MALLLKIGTIKQIAIHTANFLQKFVATENTVCRLFVDIATA
jgi:hypothetical protein